MTTTRPKLPVYTGVGPNDGEDNFKNIEDKKVNWKASPDLPWIIAVSLMSGTVEHIEIEEHLGKFAPN